MYCTYLQQRQQQNKNKNNIDIKNLHNRVNSVGHMSQTGPKKCFIPQNCRKYTNFD